VPQWADSFAQFFADMGQRPSLNIPSTASLTRNGNYEPGNCRWATDAEQNRNRGEFNALVTFRGETRTIGEWVEITGLPRDTVYWRLSRAKWSPERALTEPVRLGRAGKRGPASDAARASMSAGQRRRWASAPWRFGR